MNSTPYYKSVMRILSNITCNNYFGVVEYVMQRGELSSTDTCCITLYAGLAPLPRSNLTAIWAESPMSNDIPRHINLVRSSMAIVSTSCDSTLVLPGFSYRAKRHSRMFVSSKCQSHLFLFLYRSTYYFVKCLGNNKFLCEEARS